MKKIAKLSLVAAVAVAGLTSANAQPLEEAIKNVDVSGSVVYRYNDYNDNDLDSQANPSSSTNYYKVGVNLSSKVNDDVKFNSRVLVADDSGDFAEGGLDTQSGNDANPTLSLSHANFAYTGIMNTTVTVGKQGLTTPWTVALDSDGNEQTGTGILALSTVGPVTLAGAYFNQTNLNNSGDVKGTLNSLANTNAGNNDIATVGAIATLGAVTLDAWYLDMNQVFDSYTVGAKVADEVSGIKLGGEARYSSVNADDLTTDNAGGKIVLTADAGLVDAKVAYGWTDKEGGIVALDRDATTSLIGWNLWLNDKTDADYWQAVLGFDILSNLNLSANYGNLQYSPRATSDVEQEEVYAQLLYKMSKNFSTYIRYGTYTMDTTTSTGNTENNDDTRGRLQVEYTF